MRARWKRNGRGPAPELKTMKKASGVFRYLLLALILELVSWRGVFGQTPGQASLIEAAKKEGHVVWYAALNISDSSALLSRFNQKYPFIKTELLRAGSEQLLNRILTEDCAGRSALDLVNITMINALKSAISCRHINRRSRDRLFCLCSG